jgi:hypothetical protein
MYAESGTEKVLHTFQARRWFALLRGQRIGHHGQSLRDALTAIASTLLNAKAVRLEGASLTPKQVHAFCDHDELLIAALSS